jgi:OOP family OmpA-OmpF porin
VLDRLVADGVPGERLVAGGYGQTRPRATNDTVEGRAMNRRIEFNVLG